jgi:hypothetical protein
VLLTMLAVTTASIAIGQAIDVPRAEAVNFTVQSASLTASGAPSSRQLTLSFFVQRTTPAPPGYQIQTSVKFYDEDFCIDDDIATKPVTITFPNGATLSNQATVQSGIFNAVDLVNEGGATEGVPEWRAYIYPQPVLKDFTVAAGSEAGIGAIASSDDKPTACAVGGTTRLSGVAQSIDP